MAIQNPISKPLAQGQIGVVHLNSLLAPRQIPSLTLAQANALGAANYPGQLINVTNGNAGANTLAFSDGTNWKVIALGATIS